MATISGVDINGVILKAVGTDDFCPGRCVDITRLDIFTDVAKHAVGGKMVPYDCISDAIVDFVIEVQPAQAGQLSEWLDRHMGGFCTECVIPTMSGNAIERTGDIREFEILSDGTVRLGFYSSERKRA